MFIEIKSAWSTHDTLLFHWPYSVLLLPIMHCCFISHAEFYYYPQSLFRNWSCSGLLLPMMHCCFIGDAALIYYPQCTTTLLCCSQVFWYLLMDTGQNGDKSITMTNQNGDTLKRRQTKMLAYFFSTEVNCIGTRYSVITPTSQCIYGLRVFMHLKTQWFYIKRYKSKTS